MNDMRQIKFRCWDSKTENMFYPDEYGNFSRVVNDDRIGSDFDYTDLLDPSCKYLLPLQFTSLKDKNGKEIYEGDIVRWRTGKIARVVWCEGGGWAVESMATKSRMGLWRFPNELVEVTGNIYENPELLTP